MKLSFEKWLENETEIYENVQIKEVFEDAVLCFKNGIYRPALHLSYVGFLFLCRERMLLMSKPDVYEIGEWNNLQAKFRDDSKWEDNVFIKLNECQSNDKSLFGLNDDLRIQISYWRGRRNDCAHYKNNKITEAEVVSFWNFLESKLANISPKEGLLALIDQIKRFYDPIYTSVNEDITPLIKSIERLISETNKDEIFNTIYNQRYNYQRNNLLIPFYKQPKIKDFLISYIINNPDKKFRFLSDNPEEVYSLIKPEDIRALWKKDLKIDSNLARVGFHLYASMYSYGMIPSDQIEESAKSLLSLFLEDKTSMNIFDLSTSQISSLRSNEMYRVFISNFLSKEHLNSVATSVKGPRSWRYIDIIRLFGLNKEVVEAICDNFNEGMFPWALQTNLKIFINDSEKPELKEEFEKIVIANNLIMSTWLK